MSSRKVILQAFIATLIFEVFFLPIQYAQGSTSEPRPRGEVTESAQIMSVRKTLHHQNPLSRFPQIRYYDLYISLRIDNQTYCSEYETPVREEIDELFSTSGKAVGVTFKGKGLLIRTSNRRRLKTHLVNPNQCNQHRDN